MRHRTVNSTRAAGGQRARGFRTGPSRTDNPVRHAQALRPRRRGLDPDRAAAHQLLRDRDAPLGHPPRLRSRRRAPAGPDAAGRPQARPARARPPVALPPRPRRGPALPAAPLARPRSDARRAARARSRARSRRRSWGATAARRSFRSRSPSWRDCFPRGFELVELKEGRNQVAGETVEVLAQPHSDPSIGIRVRDVTYVTDTVVRKESVAVRAARRPS